MGGNNYYEYLIKFGIVNFKLSYKRFSMYRQNANKRVKGRF